MLSFFVLLMPFVGRATETIQYQLNYTFHIDAAGQFHLKVDTPASGIEMIVLRDAKTDQHLAIIASNRDSATMRHLISESPNAIIVKDEEAEFLSGPYRVTLKNAPTIQHPLSLSMWSFDGERYGATILNWQDELGRQEYILAEVEADQNAR